MLLYRVGIPATCNHGVLDMVEKLMVPFCVSLFLAVNACTVPVTGHSSAAVANAERGATLPKETEVVTSVRINGRKFLISASSLSAGDSVYDTELRQTAVVKNQIVVVTDAASNDVLAEYVASYPWSIRSKRLAGATEALYFNAANSDLLWHYQHLKTLQGIKRVEMQFDYSPEKKSAYFSNAELPQKPVH